jgi:DNA-binding NtrC family response regulator
LDEIGELPVEAQAKLLRVIEQHLVRRVGSSAAVAVDVRLIAATNLDLSDAVARRLFRPDLFHRLNALTIRLPPLRERLDDLSALAEHFLAQLRRDKNQPCTMLSASALRRLHDHAWPGNIRELQNTIRHAFFAANGGEISLDHVELCDGNSTTAIGGKSALPHGMTLAEALEEQERAWLAVELSRHPDLASAAKALGIDPKTLYGKRKRHRL